jgi:hypothetical protein
LAAGLRDAQELLAGNKALFQPDARLLASVVLCGVLPCNVYAQYSDDLKDIVASHWLKGHFEQGMHRPTPIGNLGDIDVVVDLRVFLPMSFWSAEAEAANDHHKSDNFKGDVLRWYKIPTKKSAAHAPFRRSGIDPYR